VDIELEELKQLLRSKRFSLDDVRPLAERAVRAIDRLEAENRALVAELRYYQAADVHLKKIREAIKVLFSENTDFNAEQIAHRIATLLDNHPPSPV
jgi:phage terminase Nu1 subunit (DNA packaging protein)